jgi:hypothetical protein
MDLSQKILSDITVYSKYARFNHDKQRRETWDEIIDRNKAMHVAKYPSLANEIGDVYERSVRTKKVLPSMRSLQFAGKAIERNPSRIYNSPELFMKLCFFCWVVLALAILYSIATLTNFQLWLALADYRVVISWATVSKDGPTQ